MMHRWLGCAALAAAPLVLALGGCSSPNEERASDAPPAAPAAASSSRSLVVTQAPRGAVILLEPVTPEDFPLPPGHAVMDQFGRAFIPETLIVRVGQVVEFRNSEDVLHNVHVHRAATGASIFNVERPPFDTYTHTFDQPGFYDVSCDTHPGMRATLVVTNTPFAGLADDRGGLTFPDVPPGAYTLKVSGNGVAVERPVEIVGPRTEVRLGS